MKQACVILIIFVCNYSLFSQKMTGIVYDAEQNPIPSANVAFKKSAIAVSNHDGKFIFENLYKESIKEICEKPQEKLSVSINGVKHNFTAEVNCTQNRVILNVNSIIGKKALITLISEGITNEKITLEFEESGQNYKSDSKGQIIMSHKIMNRLCNKRINPQFKVVSNNDENKNYEVSSWLLDCDTKIFKVSLKEKTKTEEKNNTTEKKTNEKTEEKTKEKSNNQKVEEKSNEKPKNSKETNKTNTNNDNKKNLDINLLESEKELAILVENQGQRFLAMPLQKQTKFIEYHIEKLNEQNKTIEQQIKSLQSILKNDATLSEEEKLDISDQINALRKKLHLNKLAVGNLNERLIDLHKSFFQRYLNAIIVFAVILIALGAVAYLLAILAKRRKKQRDEIAIKNQEIELQKQESERLLLNILPEETAQELKKNGQVAPKLYDSASVLFTDFQGFSSIAKELTPEQVISELDFYFGEFEKIGEKFSLEKIKTMGDAFMAVGGLPLKNQYNAIDTVCAALQMQKFIQDKVKENIEKGQKPWNVRIGIHTGELVAGVIGKTKFAYDVWGNTVNLAARMESTSENGKIQITQFTYDLVKDYFDCTLRGEVEAKNIGKIQTYFVNGLKSEYSIDGFEPNEKYWGRRNA